MAKTQNSSLKPATAEGREKISRRLSGLVVSDKSDKTIIVRVDRVKKHPKYHKRYTVSRKYKVHDEKNEFKTGDVVIFVECRPLSRDKRWRALKLAK